MEHTTTYREPRIKDLTDQGVADAIDGYQRLLAVELAIMGRKVGSYSRLLDIAVAVKRQRQRAGTWSLAA